jgi:peptidoglycan/xylan/chitin deacetylase (PgdA/CDA1 family)
MHRLVLAAALLCPLPALADHVITRLPGSEKVVALTFDACESLTPAHLDTRLVEALAREGVPYTIFVSGKFARHHQAELKELADSGRVEIENHSFDHPQHMERLPAEKVRQELDDTNALLQSITGKPTRFFRFPAGNYDARTLAQVESLGYKVVHWGTPSGDPSPAIDADRMVRGVLGSTKPGSIHIFHINGRGWHTAEAMPRIIDKLRAQGYRFVRLDEVMP